MAFLVPISFIYLFCLLPWILLDSIKIIKQYSIVHEKLRKQIKAHVTMYRLYMLYLGQGAEDNIIEVLVVFTVVCSYLNT